jgi:hypothetical protein
MQEATLKRIVPKARLAEVSIGSAAAATALMAGQNRDALQRHLRSIFHRPLMIRATCSK